MKLRLNKLILAMAVTGLVTSIVVGCGGGGVPEIGVVTPEQPAIVAGYKYQFSMVDALTGTPITDSLTVTLKGTAVDTSDTVVDKDNVSVKGKTYTVTNGIFSAAAAFDGTNNVFTVVVGNRAKGWNETGIEISRDTSSVGTQTITLKLNNTNATSVAQVNASQTLGLAMQVTPVTTSGGALVSATASAPVAVSTAPKEVTNVDGVKESVGTATVSFPQGVKAVDSAGNAIAVTGDISVVVTKFSNNEASSLSAFPGGFVPSVTVPDTPAGAAAIGTGATADTGAFVSGGFAQFNVTDSTGQALKTFDKPLDLKIDLPKTSLNADGGTIKAGDTYPIWSFNEASGKWVFETNGTVQEKTPVDVANFEVTFQAKHLSYWNLDYYGQTCNAKLNLTGRPAGDNRALYVDLVGAAGSNFYRTKGPITDSSLDFARYPNNAKVTVTVKDAKGVKVGEVKNVNLCQTAPVNSVKLTLPTVTLTSLTTNITESCSDGVSAKRADPTWVYYYTTSGTWYSGYATKPTTDAKVATLKFDGIETGTQGTLYVYNRFTGRYDTTSNFTVTAPGTVQNVNYSKLACTTGGVAF